MDNIPSYKKYYYHINDENIYSRLIDRINISKSKCIVFLNGEVGAGKTSFVKSYLSNQEDFKNDATSPTFTIVNEYPSSLINIYHYDFYRLKNKNELIEIGIDYYLDQPGIHFIEWPDNFLEYLPKPDINICFIMLAESRLIKVEINDG